MAPDPRITSSHCPVKSVKNFESKIAIYLGADDRAQNCIYFPWILEYYCDTQQIEIKPSINIERACIFKDRIIECIKPYSECYSSENLENYKNELNSRIMKLVLQKVEMVEKMQNGWKDIAGRLEQLKNCHQIMENSHLDHGMIWNINNGHQMNFSNILQLLLVMIVCFYGVL